MVIVDVWSVGCILAELLGGKPFFKGRDYVDQLNQILHYLGTPDEGTLSRIGMYYYRLLVVAFFSAWRLPEGNAM